MSKAAMVLSPLFDVDTADSELQLLVPMNDVSEPELSIVIPALNEQVTIGQFVDWCMDGLRRAGISGEVLIIDSSSDAIVSTVDCRTTRQTAYERGRSFGIDVIKIGGKAASKPTGGSAIRIFFRFTKRQAGSICRSACTRPTVVSNRTISF